MPLLSDLSTLFAAYEAGTKVPATGISINGQDLSDLFAPAASGAATAPATGMLVNGQDLSTLFAGFGTTVQILDDWEGSYSNSAYSSGTVTVSAGVTFATNGTFSGSGKSGRWLAAGLNPADYEIKATLISGDALAVNNMVAFSPFDAARAVFNQAQALPGGVVLKTSLVEITIRLIANPSILLTRTVIITASAESWGPEGSFPP